MTPLGGWYFRGLKPDPITAGFAISDSDFPPLHPTEEDRDFDENCYPEEMDWQKVRTGLFRIIPNDTTLTLFLIAFARA